MQERGVFLCNVFLQRALQVFGKASSRIKGGRGREFVDVCVHISPRGAFGIRRFCSCVCAHLSRGAGVAKEFVDCFVHILSRGTEDAGDFVDGVVHICVEEYRRCRRLC
jgi:hypothetical protein